MSGPSGNQLVVSGKIRTLVENKTNCFLRDLTLNVLYTMMAKPIKTLELHYPMIQFLIILSVL